MKETFDAAALRGEQEARDERKGSLTDQLWRAARGARKALERADALIADGRGHDSSSLLAAEAELRLCVRKIAAIAAEADPKPIRPLKHRCGCAVRLGGEPAIGIREPLRSHLAKQDCPECRKGVRT